MASKHLDLVAEWARIWPALAGEWARLGHWPLLVGLGLVIFGIFGHHKLSRVLGGATLVAPAVMIPAMLALVDWGCNWLLAASAHP